MGREVTGPPYFEGRLTDLLESIFRDAGLPTERQLVHRGRENLLARLDGATPVDRGGPLLLFDAHQDTVPVDGMTIDPFEAIVRDGRIHGRGSCDVKGGMAATIAAMLRLAERRPAACPTIVLACPVNEEYGFTGATALVEGWRSGTLKLLPRAPDAAIVAEPTGLNIVVAHKGVVRWRCHTTGRATHSAQPELGVNAIYRMASVLRSLERYAKHVVGREASHPRVGPATVSVGTIHGGVSVNTVPDRCTIEIDRRVPPGEEPVTARQALVDFLQSDPAIDFPVEHEAPYMEGLPLSDEANQELADRLAACHSACGGTSRRIGVPYGTDAGVYSSAGVPTVVFGPGQIEQAHTCDEWIAVDQIRRATDTVERVCARWSP